MSEIEEIRQKKLAEITARYNSKVPDAGHPAAPVELTDSNFEEFVTRNNHVVVDCWAPWCGPCRVLSPTIDSLARDMNGEISFGKLNTDENLETARRYRITSIPTLLYFRNGKLVNKTIGALPRKAIEDQLKIFQ